MAIKKRKDVNCTVPYKNDEVNDNTAAYYEKHKLKNKSIQLRF